MATGDFPPAARCCCNQHGHFQTIVGSIARSFATPVTFSDPGMAEHVRRAVDDYMATLGEVEDDAATVVELLQRGDSWHVSIRRGAMHYENAEPSLPAALEAVGRVLGESAKARRYQLDLDIDTSEAMAKLATLEAAAERVAEQQRAAGQSVGSCAEVPTAPAWKLRIAEREMIRAELLASLPPVQITDPEALAKLTPARVRAYLKGKGWGTPSADGFVEDWKATPFSSDRGRMLQELGLREGRSAAAVYLDILQTEPEAPSDSRGGYAP